MVVQGSADAYLQRTQDEGRGYTLEGSPGFTHTIHCHILVSPFWCFLISGDQILEAGDSLHPCNDKAA